MKIRLMMASIIACCGISACASPLPQIDYYAVDLHALQRIRAMTVVDDAARKEGSWRELGTVKGLYCDRNRPHAGSAEKSAIDQAMLRAAMKGADHIGMPSCTTRTTWDLTNNCFSTTTCSAEALAVSN